MHTLNITLQKDLSKEKIGPGKGHEARGSHQVLVMAPCGPNLPVAKRAFSKKDGGHRP